MVPLPFFLSSSVESLGVILMVVWKLDGLIHAFVTTCLDYYTITIQKYGPIFLTSSPNYSKRHNSTLNWNPETWVDNPCIGHRFHIGLILKFLYWFLKLWIAEHRLISRIFFATTPFPEPFDQIIKTYSSILNFPIAWNISNHSLKRIFIIWPLCKVWHCNLSCLFN